MGLQHQILHCIEHYYTQKEALRYLKSFMRRSGLYEFQKDARAEVILDRFSVQFPERLAGDRSNGYISEKRKEELRDLSLEL